MAAGYGVAAVTIGQLLVGEVAVTGVRAVPALSPRIRFDLSWTLGHRHDSSEPNRKADEYRVVDFGGELSVGADACVVGTLFRDEAWYPIPSLAYVQTQRRSVALDLGEHRLERLEEHRAGGVLSLAMQLWSRIEMEGTTTEAGVAEIRFQVPRDDWLAVLSTFTGEQVDLLEMRYRLAYASRYQSSLEALCRAREAVDRGDFGGAAIEARKAVSLMEESVRGSTEDGLKAALADRLDEEHAKLYAGIVSRAKRMGNMTVHRAEAREYTRVEALFAIRLATILLEVVAGLLKD